MEILYEKNPLQGEMILLDFVDEGNSNTYILS